MAASAAPLTTPSPPVIMLPGHTTERETSITVECHHHAFNLVTATLDGDPSEPLFRVEAKLGTSWSWRRKVFADSPGGSPPEQRRHLFDFRHASVDPKNRWLVEAAGDKRQLAELVHQKQITSLGHSDVDATVRTVAGEDVVVSMRRADDVGEDVTVSVDGAPFARIEKVSYQAPTGVVGSLIGEKATGPSSVWKVKAADGVDLALVMVMTLCRAEMYHVWKK
ncbi:hypothetical protein diail_5370 [Diaporthe ilicicola]|nr:hypothetical protein diail_5370 [Diaporthe ilicicola]